ncbi:MAG: hypothetical protein SFV15_20485 [Polyangiaceae bacterium]|nr:hypothetical protein [Polyangiaceae bacterium]
MPATNRNDLRKSRRPQTLVSQVRQIDSIHVRELPVLGASLMPNDKEVCHRGKLQQQTERHGSLN